MDRIVTADGTMTRLARGENGYKTVCLLKWTPWQEKAVYRVLYNDYEAGGSAHITEYATKAEARDAAKKFLRG